MALSINEQIEDEEFAITEFTERDGKTYTKTDLYIKSAEIGRDYFYIPLYRSGDDFLAFPLMAKNKLPEGARLVTDWKVLDGG